MYLLSAVVDNDVDMHESFIIYIRHSCVKLTFTDCGRH